MKWLLVAAFISLLTVTSTVKLQLFLPESVDVTEGENVTLACSFSSPSTVSSGLYISWLTMPTGNIIYDSQLGNPWLGRAEFAGDKEKGDCSLSLLNVSTTLSPVFKCNVICTSCGTDDWKVEREVKLNVTAAAPRSHGGGVSGTTLAPREETSHKGGMVSAWVLGTLAVIVIIIIIVVWMKCRRFSGLCRTAQPSPCDGDYGDMPGDVRGNVRGDGKGDVNEHSVMNGPEEKKQIFGTMAV